MTQDSSWKGSVVGSFGAHPDGRPMRNAPATATSAADTVLPLPDDWTDALSGTNGPRVWDDLLRHEEARMQRYGRQPCVVLVDLLGFEEAAAWLGGDIVRQHFARVARVLVKQVRESDYVTRIDRHRFGILLTETDEVRAINFVDRLRAACRSELGEGRLGFSIRIGWSSPDPSGSLADAMETALERLASDPFA